MAGRRARRGGPFGRHLKAVTPWLLDRLSAQSGGLTLPANLALLASNAAVATDVAGALAGTVP